MNLPITQSILHGSLRPNLCNLKFMELEAKFEQLPDTLHELERLFINTLPDIRFDFDSERPFCLNNISSKDYTPLDDDMIYNRLNLTIPEPASPKETFYQYVVKAEMLRLKLAISDFSIKQQSDTDTKYEIKSTLTNIIKHIKYIGNDRDTILSTLRTQLICLYVELSQMASPLLIPNEDCYTFKNLIYEVYDRYPNKEETEIYENFVGNTHKKNTDDKAAVLEGDNEEYQKENQHDKFVKTVYTYRFFELEKVASLSKSKQKKLIHLIIEKPVAYSVVMLKHIGYFDNLLIKYRLKKEETFKHIAEAINTSSRNVKGNYNVLNPNSKEDALTYNSHLYIDEVEKDYKKL